MRFRKTETVCLLLFFFFLLSATVSSAGEDAAFSVKRIGQMISHAENSFSVEAPENGLFSVTIRDAVHTYRVIREEVNKGSSQITWDGCGYNGETLSAKYYSFEFELLGESGQKYLYSFDSPIVSNAQHLQFVLPSGDTVRLSSPEEWFLEIKSVLDGTLVLDFCPDDPSLPSFSAKLSLHLRRVEHYTFQTIIGKKTPEAGNYTVRAYEISRPDEIVSFPLCIESGTLPETAVGITEMIMPSADAEDSEIWNEMMKPSVIINIDYQEHQNVYSEPDSKSRSLGTLHGQTQCVSVLEISDDWAKIGAWNHEDASYMEGWVPYRRLKVIQPNREYGILLDKSSQTMTLFYHGNRIETLLVSTGRMDNNHFDRETSAGCFVTGLHRVDFSTQGNRYDFVIQYDGGNLLHQIPYTSDGKKDFTMGRAYLGTKASHACIRIQSDPGPQSGINAYWIWTHVPYHTKIIILDDPEEREKEKAILTGNTPVSLENNPADTGSGPDPSLSDETVTITFGGDVTPGITEDYNNNPQMIGALLDRFGIQYPFISLYDLFSSDDLTCLNLDCVLKENSAQADLSRNIRFRGLPEYADLFALNSVELVCLANDHAYDYREEGYESTVTALENKTEWIGRDHLSVLEIKGSLFGFGACTEKDYLADPSVIQNDIRSLRDSGCRYVIYQCHWGSENDDHHGLIQEAMARACERAGADVVIGHQPNFVQGIDTINGMPVIYSLGKLLNSGSVRVRSYDALIVQVTFYINSDGKRPEIRLIPVLSSSSADDKINDYLPCLARGEDKNRILSSIQADSAIDILSLSDENQ